MMKKILSDQTYPDLRYKTTNKQILSSEEPELGPKQKQTIILYSLISTLNKQRSRSRSSKHCLCIQIRGNLGRQYGDQRIKKEEDETCGDGKLVFFVVYFSSLPLNTEATFLKK